MYKLRYTRDAENDLKRLKKNEPLAFKKVGKLLIELMEHPTTGTGHPHLLSGGRNGQWARSITKKHRLVYKIEEEFIVVIVLSAIGHYDDK